MIFFLVSGILVGIKYLLITVYHDWSGGNLLYFIRDVCLIYVLDRYITGLISFANGEMMLVFLFGLYIFRYEAKDIKRYYDPREPLCLTSELGHQVRVQVFAVQLVQHGVPDYYTKHPDRVPLTKLDSFSGKVVENEYTQAMKDKLTSLIRFVQSTQFLNLHIGSIYNQRKWSYELQIALVETVPQSYIDRHGLPNEIDGLRTLFREQELPRSRLTYYHLSPESIRKIFWIDDDALNHSTQPRVHIDLGYALWAGQSKDGHQYSSPNFLYRYEFEWLIDGINDTIQSRSQLIRGNLPIGTDIYNSEVMINHPRNLLHLGSVDSLYLMIDRILYSPLSRGVIMVSDSDEHSKGSMTRVEFQIPLLQLIEAKPRFGKILLRYLMILVSGRYDRRLLTLLFKFIDKIVIYEGRDRFNQMVIADFLRAEIFESYKIDLSKELLQFEEILAFPGFQRMYDQDQSPKENYQIFPSTWYNISNKKPIHKQVIVATLFLMKQYRIIRDNFWLTISLTDNLKAIDTYLSDTHLAQDRLFPHEIIYHRPYLDLNRNKSWIYLFDTFSGSTADLNANFRNFFANKDYKDDNTILLRQHDRIVILQQHTPIIYGNHDYKARIRDYKQRLSEMGKACEDPSFYQQIRKKIMTVWKKIRKYFDDSPTSVFDTSPRFNKRLMVRILAITGFVFVVFLWEMVL